MANRNVVTLQNVSYVTVQNLNLQGLSIRIISISDSQHVGILNNTLRWGSDAGLSLLAVNAGRIMHNTITQNGCGVYLTTKFEYCIPKFTRM